MKDRGEANRNLLYQWTEGKQTLQGLKGIVKDTALIYKSEDAQSILRAIKAEFEYGVKYVIVPTRLVSEIEEQAKGLTVLGLENCLFID